MISGIGKPEKGAAGNGRKDVLAVEIDAYRGIVLGGSDPRGQLVPVMAAQTIGW